MFIPEIEPQRGCQKKAGHFQTLKSAQSAHRSQRSSRSPAWNWFGRWHQSGGKCRVFDHQDVTAPSTFPFNHPLAA